MSYKFVLPLRPPSVNTYWRKWQNRMVISKAGREFKRTAREKLIEAFCEDKPYACPLKLKISLYFKDNRKRDIDNYCKGILDSMTGIVYEDDSQIDKLTLEKFIGTGEDKIIIELEEIE